MRKRMESIYLNRYFKYSNSSGLFINYNNSLVGFN